MRAAGRARSRPPFIAPVYAPYQNVLSTVVETRLLRFKMERHRRVPPANIVRERRCLQVIKTLALLRKADSVSDESFRGTWSHAARAQLSDGVRRSVLYEVQPPPPSPPGSPPLPLQVDGLEEVWFDSETALAAYRASTTWPAFGAVAAMTQVVFEEATIVDELPAGATGGDMLKRLVVLIRKSGFSHEQFIRHWVDVHAPLAKRVTGGARKYCQLYVMRALANRADLPTLGVEIDGFSESWFDDAAHLGRSLDVPGGAELARDNRVYVETSKLIFYKEIEIKAPS